MKTVSDKPEHKPSESHTLDEVLKSLQDLIRSELLDAEPKPPPPPKISHGKVGRPRKAPPSEPAAPKAPDAGAAPPGIESVMRSLKALVSNELADPSAASTALPSDAPESNDMPTKSHAAPEMAGAAPIKTVRAEVSGKSLTPKLEMTPNQETEPQPSTRKKPIAPRGGLQQEFLLDAPEPSAETAAPEPDVLTLDLDELSGNPEDDASGLGPYRTEATEPLTAEADEDASPESALADSGLCAESSSSVMETEPPAADIDLEVEPIFGTTPAGELPDEELVLESTPEPDATESAEVPAPGDDAGGAIAPAAFEPEETLLPLEPLPKPDIELAEQPAGAGPGPAESDVPVLGESVNFDDIPVLSDVVVPPAAAEPVTGTPYTPELPFPADRVRELAIRVVAKLNISLRRTGERPLDPRTIDRLQQILFEELEKAGKK